MSESGNNLIFEVDSAKTGMDADIYVNDRHILSTRVGKRGKIIIAKRSGSGKRIVNAIMSKNDIKLVVHD